MKIPMHARFLGALVLFLASTGSGALVHPGILHSGKDLEFMKAKIASGAEPWNTAFTRLKADATSQMTYAATPFTQVLCGSYNKPNTGCNEINDDARAAYSHALLWALTGNQKHADKSQEILAAWAAKFQKADSSNARLVVAWAAPFFSNAAELLAHTNSGWTTVERSNVTTFLRKFLAYVTADELPENNWTQSRIEAHMALAVFLDDEAGFQSAVSRWRYYLPVYIYQKSDGTIPFVSKHRTASQIPSAWKNPGTYVDGLCMETCRDLGHLGLGFGSMMYAAENAWHQGVDVFTPNKERLADFMELHGSWMTGGVAVPSNVCGGVVVAKEGDASTAVSPTNPGGEKAWEIAYGHLSRRIGMSLPYSLKMLKSQRPAGASRWLAKWETLTHGERTFGTTGFASRPEHRQGVSVRMDGGFMRVGSTDFPVAVSLRDLDGSMLWSGRISGPGAIPMPKQVQGVLLVHLHSEVESHLVKALAKP